MNLTELIHENNFERQRKMLSEKYPRIDEILECAEWQIGMDYERFHCVDSDESVDLYVWRSNDSDISEVPTVEVAYYYSRDDGCIYLLGVRVVPQEDM